MEDPIEGSCQATRKIQDPSLANGSQTSLPSRERTKEPPVEEPRVERSKGEGDSSINVANSPVSSRTRSKLNAPKQTAVGSGRPDPLLIACALIATELSESSRFETSYGKIGDELLCRGNGVNPESQID